MKAKRKKTWYPRESGPNAGRSKLLALPFTAPGHFSALQDFAAADPSRSIPPVAETPREAMEAVEADRPIELDAAAIAFAAPKVRRW